MPDTHADFDALAEFESTLPDSDADFPIRRELLGRVGEPGPLGDVALTLTEGVKMYASYDGGVSRYLDRVFRAGPGVYRKRCGDDIWRLVSNS